MHFLASWKRALGIDLISYRSYSFVSLFRGFAFLTRVYVEYSLQNRFVFFISLFGLSAILKIRNGEHVHYVGLVVACKCSSHWGKSLICLTDVVEGSSHVSEGINLPKLSDFKNIFPYFLSNRSFDHSTKVSSHWSETYQINQSS